MNTVNTPQTVTEGATADLPTLHLVVSPAGEHEAIREALTNQPDLLVLRWRLSSEALKLVNDAELSEIMKQRLLEGGDVAVWHGGMALDHADLHSRLGPQWATLCKDHLTWARINLVDNPGTVPWTPLARRLDRPDESAVRQMFFSDGQRLPSWSGLSEALNLQARMAHAAWYQVHLAPLQEAIDEEVARHSPETSRDETEADEPTDGLEFDDDLPTDSSSDSTYTGQTPFYENRYGLEAGALSAATLDHGALNEVISAQLQQTSHAQRWLASEWRVGIQMRLGESPPVVQIILDPDLMECQVSVTLPAGDVPGRWALRLYPNEGLPFTLLFESKDGQTDAKPTWPEGADLQPDAIFWQSIKSGRVGLDRLS